MGLFELHQDRMSPVVGTTFRAEGIRERADLQRLLRDQIEIIAPETLIIAEEFGDWDESRRRIDLLGVDRDANLVVIELKRTEDGGHMDLQALRYAAMVSQMTFEQAVYAYSSYLAGREREEDAQAGLLEFLGWDEADEERFGQDVRIVLASAEVSKEITTSVLWLNDHGLDIRCVRLVPYQLDQRLLVHAEQIIPLQEAESYQVKVREKADRERTARRRRQAEPWTGYMYVNVGDGSHRSWEDCRRHGFVSAGNGPRYSGGIRRLSVGNWLYAYQKARGYVGLGRVVSKPVRAREFVTAGTGKRLRELDLAQPGILKHADDPDKTEWLAAVEWSKTVPLTGAMGLGLFANQNIVCKLRHAATLEFLAEAFGTMDSSS